MLSYLQKNDDTASFQKQRIRHHRSDGVHTHTHTHTHTAHMLAKFTMNFFGKTVFQALNCIIADSKLTE